VAEKEGGITIVGGRLELGFVERRAGTSQPKRAGSDYNFERCTDERRAVKRKSPPGSAGFAGRKMRESEDAT